MRREKRIKEKAGAGDPFIQSDPPADVASRQYGKEIIIHTGRGPTAEYAARKAGLRAVGCTDRQTGAPEGTRAVTWRRIARRGPSRGPRSPTPCPAAGAAAALLPPALSGRRPEWWLLPAFPLRGVAVVVGATCQSAMHVVHLAANWQRLGASEDQIRSEMQAV